MSGMVSHPVEAGAAVGRPSRASNCLSQYRRPSICMAWSWPAGTAVTMGSRMHRAERRLTAWRRRCC